jgi:hypothetical protein
MGLKDDVLIEAAGIDIVELEDRPGDALPSSRHRVFA